MSSWDGRCKRCRRLMSICKCFVAPPANGDQNNNPNGLDRSSGDDDDAMTSPMQLAHGKRHLFETLKERHPMRSNVLLESIHGAGEQDSSIHEPQYTQQQRKMSISSGARSRTDTRASQSQHSRVGAGIASRRPPSSSPAAASSSVPAISSHISRPSTSTGSVHRHSSPVPPRPPTAIPMPTSNPDPAGIKYYQTHQQSSSSSRPSSSTSSSNRRSQRVDSAQYYVPGGSSGCPVMTPDEADPTTYEL